MMHDQSSYVYTTLAETSDPEPPWSCDPQTSHSYSLGKLNSVKEGGLRLVERQTLEYDIPLRNKHHINPGSSSGLGLGLKIERQWGHARLILSSTCVAESFTLCGLVSMRSS